MAILNWLFFNKLVKEKNIICLDYGESKRLFGTEFATKTGCSLHGSFRMQVLTALKANTNQGVVL